ncbi:tetratricopeptide repeat protein [Parasphingopyxis algicola]|uniref:tetratricopeptide repeat protein n=1 Tax=Parasphingopyxis algicola TaxID=2026624 RepID=UPI0015A43837|nr:tetratricopeptide repeat protein [Parasphingopyxis algicola]QLC24594.1 tetratricopeptide repeat protein [Parasphingopyxis algicola]
MMRWIGVLIATLCIPAAVDAAWHRAESDHFIIYAELSEDEIRERAIELESLDRVMRAMTGTPEQAAEVKLRVYMVTNYNAVVRYHGGGDVAGFYNPSMRGPFAVVPRRNVSSGTLGMTANHVLFHEYAHHFMYQYAPSTYPSWYVEGFAELFATAEIRDDGWVEIGRPLPRGVASFQWGRRLRYADILSNAQPNANMTYVQGWILVHYAAFDSEAGALLNRYLQALAQGTSGSEAYAATFGRLDEPLDRTLRDYGLGRRVPGIARRIEPIDPSTITITELSEVQAEIAMLFPRNPDRLERQVRRAVERYPNEAQAHVELARSLEADEDMEAAMRAIDRALQLDPDHVEANNMKGDQLIMAARATDDADDPNWELARQHYLRANRSDPRNARALHGYFDSYPDPQDRPDNAMAALESAFLLVPQNAHLRIDLARAYLDRGEYRDALDAIMPVVQTPHVEPGDEIVQIADAARRGLAVDSGTGASNAEETALEATE